MAFYTLLPQPRKVLSPLPPGYPPGRCLDNQICSLTPLLAYVKIRVTNHPISCPRSVSLSPTPYNRSGCALIASSPVEAPSMALYLQYFFNSFSLSRGIHISQIRLHCLVIASKFLNPHRSMELVPKPKIDLNLNKNIRFKLLSLVKWGEF